MRRGRASVVIPAVLLLLLLLVAPPAAHAKARRSRKAKGGASAKGASSKKKDSLQDTHARLSAQRERLRAKQAEIEESRDAAEQPAAPVPALALAAMQPEHLPEIAAQGYTIVRALVPADVAIGVHHSAHLSTAHG